MASEAVLGVVLWTTDIAALSRFLEQAAGMTVDERHPGFAALSREGSSVILHDDEAARAHPWYKALHHEGVARGIGAELHMRVEDVERAYRTAINLGGLAIQVPTPVEGGEECQVMGPDGYVFAFWRRV
jgi:catechol 2,3-dioxygenase-like lactoylglutathione lyase family enzyme